MHAHALSHTHIQTHTHTHKHTCTLTLKHTCTLKDTWILTLTHIHTQTHMHTHSNTHSLMHTHSNTFPHAHTLTHSLTLTHLLSHMHIHSYTHSHTHIFTHILTHTLIHSHTYTLTHPCPARRRLGLGSAKGGIWEKSMVFPAAGLLLPESEGGRNGSSGGRGRVGVGWSGGGGTGWPFRGKITFSLETLHGFQPSTLLLQLPFPAFPGTKAGGGEEEAAGPTWTWTRSDIAPQAWATEPRPCPVIKPRPLTTTLPYGGKLRHGAENPPSPWGAINPKKHHAACAL